MKSYLYLAATFLLGFTDAAVHKLKLQKISLSEQLVCLATSYIWVSQPFTYDRSLAIPLFVAFYLAKA